MYGTYTQMSDYLTLHSYKWFVAMIANCCFHLVHNIEAEHSVEKLTHDQLDSIYPFVRHKDKMVKIRRSKIMKMNFKKFFSLQPDDECSVLQLEKKLRVKISELHTEKQGRVDDLRRLKAEDERLCQGLSATPYSISSGTVPSLRQLEELQQHVKGLEMEQVINDFNWICAKCSVI